MDENRYTPELRFDGFTEPWKQQELGNIAKIVAGGDVDKRRLRPTGKYPVLANALTNDGIVGYYDDSYRIEAPAVTVTGRGEVGHAKARFAPFTPVVRLLAVITKSDVSFIAEAINLTNIALESTGVPQLTVPQLASVQLRIPDTVEEQQAIGTFFHKLDSLITLQQRKYERLQHLKQALLRKMFPKPGEQVPELRFDGFTEPWKERKLGECGTVKTGPFGSMLHAGDYVNDGIPIVTTEHFKAGDLPTSKMGLPQVSEIDAKRLAQYTAAEGDILFSRVGSVDVNAQVTAMQNGWLFSGRVLRVRPEKGICDASYLHYELQTTYIRRSILNRAVGGTMASINTAILEETKIRVASSLSEQYQIGSFFRKLDNLTTLYQSECERLQHLKQAMLQRMFV